MFEAPENLKDKEVVGMFQKRNYKVHVSIGSNELVMEHMADVLDTGADEILIYSQFIY